MFAADKGSVIDVARPDKADKNLGRTVIYSYPPHRNKRCATDVTSSYDDNANQAATGTVIALFNWCME